MIKNKLIYGDFFKEIRKIKSRSIDFIFADPPYFISNGGITCKSGKMQSVDKGDWDKSKTLNEKHKFNLRWIRLCKRVLKDDGTIMISGTFHNIYSVGLALESLGYKIINNITWEKSNPPPNLSCKYFTHSTETILWAKKDNKLKHTFNYSLMKEENQDKQMKDVWKFACINKKEKMFGYHPTQKPRSVMERIILLATKENDLVLDPFMGTSTTGVAAIKNERRFIGIEKNLEYFRIAENRIKNLF